MGAIVLRDLANVGLFDAGDGDDWFCSVDGFVVSVGGEQELVLVLTGVGDCSGFDSIGRGEVG